MYVPHPTIFSSITPVSGGVDMSLHTFLGISWDILLPYTILGIAIMIYSQSRLMRGQRALNKQLAKTAN